ncbi:MAG: hypothetical protein IJC71_05665 [Clostridia bacterium]|nr:hypothetical protein [Clostridia bacterium]
MFPNKISLFFWQISRIVLTPLLLASIALFYRIVTMSAEDAVHTYHAYPLMFEHILCGILFYLLFSLILTKIHHAFLHDGRN